MAEGTQLVLKGDLEKVLGELLIKEKAVVEEVKKLLPHVELESIKNGLERRLLKAEEAVKALEAGYVPVDGWFTDVESKSKWRRREVAETLKNMPDQVKEAWEKAKELGVFKSFSVSGDGDPMLVGNAGGKHYLIAAWVCLPGGNAMGFRVK